MKKLLITGVSGFIGSHCYDFLARDSIVYGLDRNPSGLKNCIAAPLSYESLCGFNTEFDCIIHLAGSGTVGEVFRNPAEEFRKTVSSTEELLRFVNEKSPDARIIYASSAAVYGNDYHERISESYGEEPFSPYGEHKLAAESMIEEDRIRNGRNNVIIRFFSVYGEGLRKQVLWDTAGRILGSIGAPVINCLGTGKERRDFIHIDDVLKMTGICVRDESLCGVYNCGTGIPTAISHAVRKLGDLLGYTGRFCFEDSIREGNPEYLVADISKANAAGFRPSVSFDSGIRRFAEWVRKERR